MFEVMNEQSPEVFDTPVKALSPIPVAAATVLVSHNLLRAADILEKCCDGAAIITCTVDTLGARRILSQYPGSDHYLTCADLIGQPHELLHDGSNFLIEEGALQTGIDASSYSPDDTMSAIAQNLTVYATELSGRKGIIASKISFAACLHWPQIDLIDAAGRRHAWTPAPCQNLA
jgi:hypothetical protein